MDKVISFATGGCFLGTLIAFYLNNYQANPFLLFLLPMWGMVLGISLARAVKPKKAIK